jgi:hypothetical protein
MSKANVAPYGCTSTLTTFSLWLMSVSKPCSNQVLQRDPAGDKRLEIHLVLQGGQRVHLGCVGHRDMQKLVLKEIDLRGTVAYVRDHPAVFRMVPRPRTRTRRPSRSRR